MDASGTKEPDPSADDHSTDEQLQLLADRIRAARRQAGLTQRALADLTGVSLRTITRLEQGLRTTSHNRRAVESYLAAAQDAFDEPDMTGDRVDLGQVSSIALLAELARRVGVTERRIGAAWPGPPARVRWKTEDGPTQSGTTDQQRHLRGHTEEA